MTIELYVWRWTELPCSEDDPLVPFIATIRQKNKRVIAFPQWPEGCEGNFTPGQKFVGDVDLRTDKKN